MSELVKGLGAPPAGATDALASAAQYARAEKAEATRRAYRADFLHFSQWCAANSVEPCAGSRRTLWARAIGRSCSSASPARCAALRIPTKADSDSD
jgi:hypothetical protein